MATTFNLEVLFRAIDQLSVPMQKMQKKLDAFSSKAQKIGGDLQKVGKGMMTYITAPIMAISAIGINEFAAQEEAIFRLQNAIKLTGREGEISVDSLVKLSDELSTMTKFSDDASLSALALVQQMGNLSEAQLKEVLPAMQDFATMMNMDLQSAATIFGKTLSTGNNYLKRNGIEFEETTDKAKFFKNMLDAVNQKSSGTAKQAAKGLSGALFQLKNNFMEIAESIGEVLAPIIIKISEKFKQFKTWFTNLDPKMKKFIVTTMLIVAAIGPLIFILGKLISIIGMVGKVFAILRMLISPQGLIILTIVAAIILIIIVIRNWGKITAWLSDKWKKLMDFIQRMPRIIFILIAALLPFITIPVLIMRNWEAIKTFFVNLWSSIWNAFDNGWVQLLGSILMPFIGIPLTIIKNWGSIADFFTGLWGGIVSAFETAIDFIMGIWKAFTGWAMKNPVLKWLFETKKKKPEDWESKAKEDADKKRKAKEEADRKKKAKEEAEAEKKKKSNTNDNKLFDLNSKFKNFQDTKAEKSTVYVNVKVSADQNSTATIEKVKTTGKAKNKVESDSNYTGIN